MASSSLHLVNPKAEVMKRAQALMINVNAAKGMSEVLKTNLGEFHSLDLRFNTIPFGLDCYYVNRSEMK